MTLRKLSILLASCLLSAAACSGGDEGSGVDGSKTLNNVTAEEAVEICEYGASQISEADSKTLGCYFGAIFQGDNEEACQMIYDACIAEPPTEPTEDACADAGAEAGMLPECASMVTVAEIEDCASAQAAATSTLANSLSCTTPREDLQEPTQPAACLAVEEKCPGLFE